MTATNGPKRQVYEFDHFRVEVGERQLLREGQEVTLPAKAFDLLVVLIENRGRLVSKDELYERLWPEQIVEESNLTVQMSALRKALGERKQKPRCIVTVAGHGYRFIGEVRPLDEDQEVVIETETETRVVIESEQEAAGSEAANAGAPFVLESAAPTALVAGDDSRIAKADSTRAVALPPAPPMLPVGVGRARLARWRRARVIGLALALALMALGAAIYWLRPGHAGGVVRSIVVLPFKPLIADSRDESLEMGMADTLIAHLSNIREVNVRPISAVRKYAGLEQDALAAGREQKVDAVLDGQIQKAGEKVRVTVRLVRVEDGAVLWTGQFDETMADIFRVQDSISERITGALAVKLTAEEKRQLTKRQTNNPEAYQLYMIGRLHFGKRTEQSLNRAFDYFKQAIAKDPNYALAYTALAAAYSTAASYEYIAPHEAYPKAREAANEALQIDDTLSEAHAVMGNIKRNYDWDLATAESEYKRAIELDPNNATAYHWYGIAMAFEGHTEESIALIKRAVALDPVSAVINNSLGDALSFARRYDQAIEQYGKVLELDPNFAGAHFHLGENYYFKNMYPEAMAELLKGETAAGITPQDVAALRAAYESAGMRGYWQKRLELLRRSSNGYKSPYNTAYFYAALGDREQAFEWLEKAYREHDPGLIAMKVDHIFDDLQSDARFNDLLRRVGLPQ